ncbi:MAG TPA: NADH-quinone oxidoreductase subunit A [Armatimonadota bacterium]|jgi:NADH-quinone oxidoreductase subunit A
MLHAAPDAGGPLWPLVVYFLAVLLLTGGIVGVSWVLGQRHRARTTDEPFESGIKPTGSASQRVSVRFYLLAMFFVIFDLETMFLITWAIAYRRVGWAGYGAMVLFVVTLLVTLAYLWRQGALDWSPRRPLPARGDSPDGVSPH